MASYHSLCFQTPYLLVKNEHAREDIVNFTETVSRRPIVTIFDGCIISSDQPDP